MKKRCIGLGLVIWLWAACLPTAGAENQPPAEGGRLPEIRMPVPKHPDQQAYLGLTDRNDFTVADIQAQVVIIEIFNMY
jgi:hypothetical protein